MATTVMMTTYKDGKEHSKKFFERWELERMFLSQGKTKYFINAFWEIIKENGEVKTIDAKYELMAMFSDSLTWGEIFNALEKINSHDNN